MTADLKKYLPNARRMPRVSDVTVDRVGFRWGPGRVVRLYDDDKFGVSFEVGGQRECVEVRVTPGGRIRIGVIKKRAVLGLLDDKEGEVKHD